MGKRQIPKEVREFLQDIGREGGKIGGKRSLETMTPEERAERARAAGKRSGEVRKKNAATGSNVAEPEPRERASKAGSASAALKKAAKRKRAAAKKKT